MLSLSPFWSHQYDRAYGLNFLMFYNNFMQQMLLWSLHLYQHYITLKIPLFYLVLSLVFFQCMCIFYVRLKVPEGRNHVYIFIYL